MLVIYLIGIYGIEATSYYKLPNDTKYVVFGDSHSECAFNDSLIDNFANFANSGEAFFYTYLKARKLIPKNKQIEVVFIEYSNNQITKEIDNWIWDDVYLPIRLPTYLPLMDYSDLRLLMDNNPNMFRNQIVKSVLKNISYNYRTIAFKRNCLKNSIRFGGYFFRTKSVVDSLILSPNVKLGKKNHQTISKLNIKYLEKTIKLCEKYNKQVILIRPPVHIMSVSLNNDDEYKRILINRFRNIDYIDFQNYPLKNIGFYDFDHLNSYGATEFSIWFNILISKGLLEVTEKQSFVNEEIKYERTTAKYPQVGQLTSLKGN